MWRSKEDRVASGRRDMCDVVAELSAEIERLRHENRQTAARLDMIEDASGHDHTLAVLGRSAFLRELGRAARLAGRHGVPSVLALLDVDGLDQINRRHGYDAGDAALRHVATLVTASLRQGQVVGRLGGDELGVLLIDTELGDAELMIEAWAARVSDLSIAWGDQHVRVAIGRVCLPLTEDEAPEALIAQAYCALRAERARLRAVALSFAQLRR